jgi:hypothetical protein
VHVTPQYRAGNEGKRLHPLAVRKTLHEDAMLMLALTAPDIQLCRLAHLLQKAVPVQEVQQDERSMDL